jgi:hypothetical protein
VVVAEQQMAQFYPQEMNRLLQHHHPQVFSLENIEMI